MASGVIMSYYSHRHRSVDWIGRRIQIRMSARQVANNVSYTGGFLGMLASLAVRALPTLFTGLSTGLLSGGISKATSRNGLFLQKLGKRYQVQKCKGDGLYLATHPPLVKGDGLFLKCGSDINDGAGLLMGKNCPFRNIPVLGWLL